MSIDNNTPHNKNHFFGSTSSLLDDSIYNDNTNLLFGCHRTMMQLHTKRPSVDTTITTTTNTNNALTTTTTKSKSKSNNARNKESSLSYFDHFPEEIVRTILSYADIASLGILMQVDRVHHNTNTNTNTGGHNNNHNYILAQLVSDDTTWGNLVQKRFHVNTAKSRSTFYGGQNWKYAYQSMHLCNRIPKSRYTNQKIVFAKNKTKSTTTKQHQKSSNSSNNSSSSTHNHPTPNNTVSVWVQLKHTENCKTRLALVQSSQSQQQQQQQQQRYVEFIVCIQNVKSSRGDVNVDILQSTLQYADKIEPCIHHQHQHQQQQYDNDNNNNNDTHNPIHECYYCSNRSRGGKKQSNQPQNTYDQLLNPKFIYKSWEDEKKQNHNHHNNENTQRHKRNKQNEHDTIIEQQFKLRPFDYCLLSLHFKCGQEDIFETDLLSRARTLSIPFTFVHDYQRSQQQPSPHSQRVPVPGSLFCAPTTTSTTNNKMLDRKKQYDTNGRGSIAQQLYDYYVRNNTETNQEEGSTNPPHAKTLPLNGTGTLFCPPHPTTHLTNKTKQQLEDSNSLLPPSPPNSTEAGSICTHTHTHGTATAHFLNEHDVWQYYTFISNGYITLSTDGRTHL